MILTSNNQELLLWLLRLRQRFRVTGPSMFPLLKEGEEVLVDTRAYRRCLPEIGDLVVAKHPYYQDLKIIKRIVLVDENGNYFLLGNNTRQSNDSRSFGFIDIYSIIGKVTSKFP
ncbi:nickel-type superoxide dismutase maturation protease [Cyanobacterium sp. uoEpiScrs1]|uniref:nickel-type superoxide dismutase maturation protease n=1 Tax=Cyanobacterium sp. uoEpiScrs1 TaxID=2976343 RepID=UPI00226A98CD|nr:nickel-type superoxide dismutase maturation protease [Cyanobacterium sp. uoEpiScrs1]